MAHTKELTLNEKIYGGLKGKLLLWLQAFLNNTNPDTFQNQTGSARAAGYQCKNVDSFTSIGHQNFTKLQDRISIWLDEVGLSEARLKSKLNELMECEETKILKVKGNINKEDLPESCVVLVDGGKDGESVLAINMYEKEIQRKTLDMALKVKNQYPKSGMDLNVPENVKIKITYED